jgi:hypothetical protein
MRSALTEVANPLLDEINIGFIRSGDDLVDGLFVQLPGWGWHMFRVMTDA